ncbi:exocrine gland-secreting peptide 34 precursor [Mus musculus]|nr:exocrine gland-secreting peptide 34 precursor [Mus musculus]BAF92749.1 exocrine gland-secreting peptide 34 [Mus musculus]|eukprot:NP_001171056.1 exocrine gland-secreting peptide 34 precursor [Mus musculus]
MASFPVMCFLLILLLPSMFTEGVVLKKDQEELIDSEDESIILISCQYIQEFLKNAGEILFYSNDKEVMFEKIIDRDFFFFVFV